LTVRIYRAEAAQGAVRRDAEPVLVCVKVSVRHALLVDEGNGEARARTRGARL
jgi:hypothetical protein